MWLLPLCGIDEKGVIHDDWGLFSSGGFEGYHYFDGTVLEVDGHNKQILVELTDSKGSHFMDGEQVMVDYEECSDVVSEISLKEGMYVSIIYWKDQLKPRQDGIARLEAYNVEKQISFVNGRWSEGTYD